SNGGYMASLNLHRSLRQWDQGGRSARLSQLASFTARFNGCTGPHIDSQMDGGASLFLARILSWLRLSYALGHSVGPLLSAIGVFIGAPSGQRFLAEFVEVGGVATVVEILKLPKLCDADRAEALLVLSCVAGSGRQYKEVLCEVGGVEALEAVMRASISEEQLAQVREMLTVIGRSNPAFVTLVLRAFLRLLSSDSSLIQLMACQGLTSVLAEIPSSQRHYTDDEGRQLPVVDEEFCRAAVAMLSSFNLQMLYEANRLFAVLISIEAVPLHMRASAARALGQLISAMPSAKRDKHASKLHVVPYLCALLLHSDQSLECEKAAVQTLQLLALCAGGIGKAMRACLGAKGVSHLVQAEPSQALSTMSPDGELLDNRPQPFAVTGLGSLVLKHTHTLAITLTFI
ncbi:MAG: hypothetical protein SGPRY_010290, partial [Prymnesium sp.]